MTLGLCSRVGSRFSIPQRKGWGRVHIALFCVLVLFCIFLACIPAIVIPLRRRDQIHTSISSTNPADSHSSLGIITVPITPVPFSPFPTPSDTPIPGVFPETGVSNPPPPSEAPGLGGLIPDFAQAWKTAHAKAKTMLQHFSLEQKVALTTGVGWEGGRCVGNIPAVADFPGLCLEVSTTSIFTTKGQSDSFGTSQDSPLGVRDTDFVTAFPTGVTTAST